MAVGGITDRQKPVILNGGKRAETLSFFCIYITTQEGNQARDPRAWFFSYPVIFSAY